MFSEGRVEWVCIILFLVKNIQSFMCLTGILGTFILKSWQSITSLKPTHLFLTFKGILK